MVIGQLWTRSGTAEQQRDDYRDRLREMEIKLTSARQAGDEKSANADQLSSQLSTAESRTAELQAELVELRQTVAQLDARNETLQDAAKQAEALQRQVTELKLDLRAARSTAEDRLVRVGRPTKPSEEVAREAAKPPEPQTAVRFDDRGWRSAK